jgi:hypothetical protein
MATSAVAAMAATTPPPPRRHREKDGTSLNFVSRGRLRGRKGRPAHARPFALDIAPIPELAAYRSLPPGWPWP